MASAASCRSVKVIRLGLISFLDALKVQNGIAQRHFDEMNGKTKEKAQDCLLLLEHFPVYTIGIRRKEYSAEDEEKLKRLGGDFVRTNRGGLITFHGPGQLVAYPVLNLKNFRKSIKWYVSQLEQTVIKMCEDYGLEAKTTSDTGVWIGDEKIAAIGIHGSRFVTTHGVAINCNTDLSWFEHIVPCGIKDKGVTSLTKQLNRTVTIDEVIPVFLDAFRKQFQCQFDLQDDSLHRTYKP